MSTYTYFEPEALGVFLKSLRIRNNKDLKQKDRLNQERLGQKIGCSARKIGRIENGDWNSTDVDLINLWVENTSGDYYDRRHALTLAGIFPYTQVPTLLEIKKYLSLQLTRLNEGFPAYILDYRMKLWALNSVCKALTREIEPKTLLSESTDILDFFFNPRFRVMQARMGNDRDALYREQILRIQLMNMGRKGEAWYRLYPEDARHRFGGNYRNFEAIWEQVQDEATLRPLTPSIFRYRFFPPDHPSVEFQTTAMFTYFPENLFTLVVHRATDNEANQTTMAAYLKPYRENIEIFTLWDEDNIAQQRLDAYKPPNNNRII